MKLSNLFKRKELIQLNSLGEPITPLKTLKYRAITVSYQPGFIPGLRLAPIKSEAFTSRIQYDKQSFQVERPAGIKVWQVAVKTLEPDILFPTHSGWMLHIMYKRSDIVREAALRENMELQRNASRYYESIRHLDCEPVDNKELPNN